jgi:hypothetical protein
VIVGGMVLEKLMGLTDEEFMDSLMVASIAILLNNAISLQE